MSNDSESGEEAAAHNEYGATGNRNWPELVQSNSERERTQQHRHRCSEKQYWRTQNRVGCVGAIMTFLAVGISGGTALVAFRALFISQQSADSAQVAANAAIEQAQAPRAYLFSQNPGMVNPGDIFGGGRVAIRIEWTISNYGETPAAIDHVETHLYIGDIEPDPLSKAGFADREDNTSPATFSPGGIMFEASTPKDGAWDAAENPQSQIIITGKSSLGEGRETFVFHNMPDWHAQTGTERKERNVWFLCIVWYKDIFRHSRIASGFFHLSAAWNSVAQHQQYNCWDDGCTWRNNTQALSYLESPGHSPAPKDAKP